MFDFDSIKTMFDGNAVDYTIHYRHRMKERGIKQYEVKQALLSGEIIEENPDDEPLPSVLILGYTQEGKNMNCYSCKGGMLEDSTTSDFNDLGNCMIIVKGVPCQKCLQCGEIIFNFQTGERIEEIVDILKTAVTGEIAIVQYSQTEVEVIQYVKAVAA